MTVVLHQTAPWNPELRNSYRERYTEANGRYYRAYADSLDQVWYVEEVDAAGDPVFTVEPCKENDYAYEFSFMEYAGTLQRARELIAADADRTTTTQTKGI